MPEPKRISDRQIEALHAIAEAIESAGRAYADAVQEAYRPFMEYANRGEAKETGPEVGISDEKPSAVGNERLAWERGYTWGRNDEQNGTETRNPYPAQIDAPVPAERTHSESGDSRTPGELGERLRALIPGTYADDGYFVVTAVKVRELADNADLAARANIALTAQVNRVRALAKEWARRGRAGNRSPDYGSFAAALDEVLDTEGATNA